MKKEETVDYNVKVTWHAISRMYNQQGLPFDITASTGFVLINIDSENGTPATKIAPLLGLEARSLTRMLKSLEEKGLIYKQQDPNDRRSVRIFLTESGKYKKEVSRRVVKDFNKKIREQIPEDQLGIFFNVIRQINLIIDQNNIYQELETTINTLEKS
ncbi:MAG: MarR family transcriptional regulator [Cyclobacteriaceae bacterium]